MLRPSRQRAVRLCDWPQSGQQGPWTNALFTKELRHCILDQASEPLECHLKQCAFIYLFILTAVNDSQVENTQKRRTHWLEKCQPPVCFVHNSLGGGVCVCPLRDTFMALNRMVLPQLVTKVTRWEAPREYERASDICLSRITLTCEIIPSAVPGRTTF